MIGVIVTFVIAIIIMVFWACYDTHLQMNESEHIPYGYVHFNTFLKEFEQYEEESGFYTECGGVFLPDSSFGYKVYLHADIVRIDDRCMMFYPMGYLKYKVWFRRLRRRVKKMQNGGV
jgi:hypothetical protein